MATRTRRTTSPKELRGELIEARTIIRFSKSGKPQYQYILKFQDGERIVSHVVDERTYTLYVTGIPASSLQQFEGFLSDEEAEAMLRAIEEGCERVDE